MLGRHLAAVLALPLLVIGLLTGCTSDEAGDSLAAAAGVSGMSGRDLIVAMDQDPAERPLPVLASVRYDEVILSDGDTEEIVPIEGDEFYISMAPYETFTHDCHFHNLATCRGELVEAEVHVQIVADDGEVLIDEDATTYANGFVGFWVPKDRQGVIVVTKDGKTATSPFSSHEDGPTCITTLPLL